MFSVHKTNEDVIFKFAGVAIGAGWQVPVAYMSCACYFIFGVPLGVVMAYKFEMGVQVRCLVL